MDSEDAKTLIVICGYLVVCVFFLKKFWGSPMYTSLTTYTVGVGIDKTG